MLSVVGSNHESRHLFRVKLSQYQVFMEHINSEKFHGFKDAGTVLKVLIYEEIGKRVLPRQVSTTCLPCNVFYC